MLKILKKSEKENATDHMMNECKICKFAIDIINMVWCRVYVYIFKGNRIIIIIQLLGNRR